MPSSGKGLVTMHEMFPETLGPQTPSSRDLCKRLNFESPKKALITPCKVVGSCQVSTSTRFLSYHTCSPSKS